MINFYVILFFVLSITATLLCITSVIIHIYRYLNDVKSRTFRIELVIMTSLLATIQQFGFMTSVILEEFIEQTKYTALMRQIEWNFLEGFNSVVAVCGTFLGAVVFISMLPSVKVIPRQGFVDFFSNRILFYGLITVFLAQSIIMGFVKPEFVAISIYQCFFSFSGVIISTTLATGLLLYWYSKLENMSGVKAQNTNNSSKKNEGGDSSSKESKSTIVVSNKKADVNNASKWAIFRTVMMFELCSLACVVGILDRLSAVRRQGILFDTGEFPRRDVNTGIKARHLHTLIGFTIGIAFLNSDETKKILVSYFRGKFRADNADQSTGKKIIHEVSSASQSTGAQPSSPA